MARLRRDQGKHGSKTGPEERKNSEGDVSEQFKHMHGGGSCSDQDQPVSGAMLLSVNALQKAPGPDTANVADYLRLRKDSNYKIMFEDNCRTFGCVFWIWK